MLVYAGDESVLPLGLTVVARDAGRVVLAYGEVTGHSHAVLEPNVELFERHGSGERWLVIRPGEATLRTIRVQPGYVPPCEIVEGPVRLADHAGLMQIVVRTAGVILEHEEHGAIVLDKPGVYKLPSQREYTPQETRRVAD